MSAVHDESKTDEGQSLLTVGLATIIDKVFENEHEFLVRFWRGNPNDELLECYMASERTKIAVLTEEGVTVTDTIPTDEFIDWANLK